MIPNDDVNSTPANRLGMSNAMLLFASLAVIVILSNRVAVCADQDPQKPLPVDRSEFTLRWPAINNSGPGILAFGGYLGRDTEHREEDYLSSNEQHGDADVDVVLHPRAYAHVVHDFFGTFRAAAHGEGMVPLTSPSVVNGVVDEETGQWQFSDWPEKGEKTNKLCYTAGPKRKAKDGIVGWYSRSDDRITTIMIRFSGLKGVPVQLIEKYLAKYPSSVTTDDFPGPRWVEQDVHKYIDLLRTQQSDGGLFRLVLGRLHRLDREAFRYRELFKADSTPEEIAEAVEIVVGRIERWLDARNEQAGTRDE